MRLGKKKEKDRELEKEQCVDGVARLICCPNPKQSHPVPLRGIFEISGTMRIDVPFPNTMGSRISRSIFKHNRPFY